jgi:hypothetical protein
LTSKLPRPSLRDALAWGGACITGNVHGEQPLGDHGNRNDFARTGNAPGHFRAFHLANRLPALADARFRGIKHLTESPRKTPKGFPNTISRFHYRIATHLSGTP